jgi:hypothetical protein
MTTKAPARIRVKLGTRGLGRCRGCQAPLVWFETERGARMPFNVGYRVDEAPEIVDPTPHGGRLVMATISAEYAHWATCPQSAAFHRRPASGGRP